MLLLVNSYCYFRVSNKWNVVVFVVGVGSRNLTLKFIADIFLLFLLYLMNSYCYFRLSNKLDVVVFIVVVNPIKLQLQFGQNWVSNIWDIADIEFPVVGGWWWALPLVIERYQSTRVRDQVYDLLSNFNKICYL